MKHKQPTIEFVQKKFSRGEKKTKGLLYWSISGNTTVRTLINALGENIVQRMLVLVVDSKLQKAGENKEKAIALFNDLNKVKKDFSTTSIRKAIDEAIRQKDYALARKLMSSLEEES